MAIIEYKATRDRKVRGTDVVAGDSLFAIYNESIGLYFIWSYAHRDTAEYVELKLIETGQPTDDNDKACNWRMTLDALTPSSKALTKKEAERLASHKTNLAAATPTEPDSAHGANTPAVVALKKLTLSPLPQGANPNRAAQERDMRLAHAILSELTETTKIYHSHILLAPIDRESHAISYLEERLLLALAHLRNIDSTGKR